jgi:RNA polymerase sigma-70 factor (ECF subfamily)
MAEKQSDLQRLVEQARGGDNCALAELWSWYEDRLHSMVEYRLDRRLTGRIDASQILKDAYCDTTSRLGEFAADPGVSPFSWFRRVVRQRLDAVHHQHLGEASEPLGSELSLFRDSLPTTSSAVLAAQLLGFHAPPTQAEARVSRILRIQEALNAMEPGDREILTLRHFERLSGSEMAQELGLEESVAARHYVIALRHLKEILSSP